MAGNIQGVNLQKLSSEIHEYGDLVTQISKGINDIYNNMANLKTYWTGKRVNQVINFWNNKYQDLNANVSYFYVQIEGTLWTIYLQYSHLEEDLHAQDVNNGFTYKDEVNKIELTDEANITFDKAKAETTLTNIEGYVATINSNLNQIVKKLDSMQTYSDSLKALVTLYQGNASSIQGTLTGLCQDIQEELNKAIQDVNETEGFNEEDAQRAGTVSQGGEPSAQ